MRNSVTYRVARLGLFEAKKQIWPFLKIGWPVTSEMAGGNQGTYMQFCGGNYRQANLGSLVVPSIIDPDAAGP